MTDLNTANPCVEANDMTKQPYEAPALVELDVEDTEAGGPGVTDAGLFS